MQADVAYGVADAILKAEDQEVNSYIYQEVNRTLILEVNRTPSEQRSPSLAAGSISRQLGVDQVLD